MLSVLSTNETRDWSGEEEDHGKNLHVIKMENYVQGVETTENTGF